MKWRVSSNARSEIRSILDMYVSDHELTLRCQRRQLIRSIGLLKSHGFVILSSTLDCDRNGAYLIVEGSQRLTTVWLLKYHHLQFSLHQFQAQHLEQHLDRQ